VTFTVSMISRTIFFARQEMEHVAHQYRRVDIDEAAQFADHRFHAELGCMRDHGGGGREVARDLRRTGGGIAKQEFECHQFLMPVQYRLPRQEKFAHAQAWWSGIERRRDGDCGE
jgi:hypothetical protein